MVAETWRDADGARDIPDRVRRLLGRIADDQKGRTFLWAPVALVAGIWWYFGLGGEPGPGLTAAAAGLALAGLWLGRGRPWLLLASLVLVGFVLAKGRAELVAGPVLRSTTPELAVTGVVEAADFTSAGRVAIILAPEAIAGLTPGATPARLRLTAPRKPGLPAIGSRISVTARLAPLPSPVMPGGFDYGRQLWFEGIGGTGRIVGPVQVVEGDPSWRHIFRAAVANVRQAIGAGIRRHLSGVNASFAEALITGERSAIPKAISESLQISGLFHILSISGLHMWLVAGGVFWVVRAGLAAVPPLALAHPIKKWAAVAALAAGFFYMLLADASVATQRSYIMLAVVFFAVLVDRPALSMRNLALSAIIILALEPEAATEASFQMSFMAVMGLAAYHEVWTGYMARRDATLPPQLPWYGRLARWMVSAFAVSILTSLVAGGFSTIPAAHHFGRLAPYGVLANGMAIPVVSFIVMPMALAGTLLMPFGLEGWPLWAMARGLDLVLAISDWVAGLPGAAIAVPLQGAAGAAVLAAGAVLACLLAGPVRLVGPCVMLAGLLAMPSRPAPDILIDDTASNVAVRNAAGDLVPALGRRSSFAVEKWLRAGGDGAKPGVAVLRSAWSCSSTRCTASVAGRSVVYVMGEAEPRPACDGIDILIAAYPLRGACGAVPLRIDRFDVWRNGSHAIRIDGSGLNVATARGAAGARPWVVTPEARRKVVVVP